MADLGCWQGGVGPWRKGQCGRWEGSGDGRGDLKGGSHGMVLDLHRRYKIEGEGKVCEPFWGK